MEKNQIFDYMTLSEFMSSVKSDLHQLDDNNLIDDDRVIKVIRNCTAKLGYRAYKHKQVLLDVRDFKVELPKDFLQIEMIYGIFDKVFKDPFPILKNHGVRFDDCLPEGYSLVQDRPHFCNLEACGNCIVVSYEEPQNDIYHKYTNVLPLKLGSSCTKICCDYCPNLSWKKQINTVDYIDGYLTTSFREGRIYLCYLADNLSEDGELLIPKDDILNPYYEWSVKAKILEDSFMNTEADVLQKYQLAESKRSSAYADAVNYINTSYSGQYEELIKNRRQMIYDKYYKMYK